MTGDQYAQLSHSERMVLVEALRNTQADIYDNLDEVTLAFFDPVKYYRSICTCNFCDIIRKHGWAK